jgi:hypothetical protein
MNLYSVIIFLYSVLAIITSSKETNSTFLNLHIFLSLISIAIIIKSRLSLRSFYVAFLLVLHAIFYIFFFYIYLNSEQVIRTPVFVFSAFTDANLKVAVNASIVALATIVVADYLASRIGRHKRYDRLDVVTTVLSIFDKLSQTSIVGVLIVLVLSFAVALVIFITNKSILEISYPYGAHINWFPRLVSSLSPLPNAIIILAYLTALAKSLKNPHSKIGKTLRQLSRLNLIVSTLLVLLIAASRGFATFVLLLLGLLELILWRKKQGSLLYGVILLALFWYLYQSFPFVRYHWAAGFYSPSEVITMSIERALYIDQDSPDNSDQTEMVNGIELNDFPMLGQSIFHMLYVIDLIDRGISLNGSTFTNLIPQAVPSTVAKWIGYQPPTNDNYRLGDYYRHTGGFIVIGNAYWNGGMIAMVGFMAVLTLVLKAIDSYFQVGKRTSLSTLVYWSMMPIFAIQTVYGIQGLVRILQVIGLFILYDGYQRRKYTDDPSQVGYYTRLHSYGINRPALPTLAKPADGNGDQKQP